MYHKWKIILGLCFVVLFFACANNTYSAEFYSFHSSEKGSNWKSLRHRIFGFSVDMPNNWQFGIVTQKNIPVVLLYPENIPPNTLSKDYMTIEISSFEGIYPQNSNLQTLTNNALRGLSGSHRDANILAQPVMNTSSGTVSATISWPSKTGLIIVEDLTLYKRNDGVAMCLNIRAAQEAYSSNLALLKEIASSLNFTK